MNSERRRRHGAAGLLLVALLAGCYDGDPADFREAVVVGRNNVSALAINGELPVIETGSTLALAALATTPAGLLDLSGDVSWRSSDPAVLLVDARGQVTALANGTAQITAELAAFTDTVTITASSALLQTITVSGGAGVDECATATYTASGHYDDGSDRDITALVSWASTDVTVARMSTLAGDRNRLVSLLAGSTGVTAARGGIVSPAYAVTVADNLDALVVTPDAPGELAEGDTLQFTATGTWGAVSADISRASAWAVANDDITAAQIATVGNGDASPGLLAAGNGGTGTLTASCGGRSDSVDVTVTYLDTLAITNTRPIELKRNASVLLVLEGTYSDGSTRPVNESATWSATLVSGAGVTVSNATGTRGRVTAGNADGIATVSAEFGGKTVSVTVSVVP